MAEDPDAPRVMEGETPGAAETEVAPIEAAEVAEAKLDLTSALVLEPADMSLAGPVAEVREIFSSSNSTGP